MAESEAQQFETLVFDLLIAQGFSAGRSPHGFEVDFLLLHEGDRWAVEAKYYRTERAQVSLIRAAALRLANALGTFSIRKGMLVVSSTVPTELQAAIEEEFGIFLIARRQLLAWSTQFPELFDRLTGLLEVTATEPETLYRPSLDEVWASTRVPRDTPQMDTRGTALCQQLRGLIPGRPTWLQYEKICESILRYLFPQDLFGWHKQLRSDDGVNRYDFVCRVRATTEFWRFLLEHVGTRYVLFEFKNYARAIKQGQVLTTEKYLLEKGLRRTAIIFTRAGVDEGGKAMIRGAMREHGKLILPLSDDQVCRMLHMKEKGEDPSDLLFEIADNFLLALPR